MDTIREGGGRGEADKVTDGDSKGRDERKGDDVIWMGRDGVHRNKEIKIFNTEEDRQ